MRVTTLRDLSFWIQGLRGLGKKRRSACCACSRGVANWIILRLPCFLLGVHREKSTNTQPCIHKTNPDRRATMFSSSFLKGASLELKGARTQQRKVSAQGARNPLSWAVQGCRCRSALSPMPEERSVAAN